MVRGFFLTLVFVSSLLFASETVWSPSSITAADTANNIAVQRSSINVNAPTQLSGKTSNILTIREISNPTASVFDITKDPTSTTGINVSKVMLEVQKISIAVDKITSMFPREVTKYQCGIDTYDNKYCPHALAPAATYWSYSDGTAVSYTATILDSETGTYEEHTATVIDYVNGTSQPYKNTEINYDSGTATTYSSSVLDYTNKTSTNSTLYSNGTATAATLYSNGTATAVNTCPALTAKPDSFWNVGEGLYIGTKNFPAGTYVTVPMARCTYGQMMGPSGSIYTLSTSAVVAYNYSCSTDYTPATTSGASTTPPTNNCSKANYNYSCPTDYAVTTTSGASSTPPTNNCSSPTIIYSCPTGYTDNGTNCKKTVSYSYYSYGCPTGYAVQNAGLTSCSKTDPDATAYNEATLDDSCNSVTPPADNCKQTLDSTAYAYVCGVGYTAIDAGLTSCPIGTSGACNSSTSPTSNCKKNIDYKYYSYGCSSGYSTLNYGLSSCAKTDPDVTGNNEATLDDSCNSVTPPAGNCTKNISYSYYEYICPSDVNNQRLGYIASNAGLTSCVKTDPSTTLNDSATLDDSCNNATPPANNCKRQEFTCNSTRIQPSLVDNQWQCSPFVCDANQQCGTASCVNGTPMPSGTAYDISSLLATLNNPICNVAICDAGLYEKLGRCGMPPKCPTAFGVYEKNSNCYQDVCPPKSTEKNLGNGQTSCLSLQCPAGYVENANGKCDVQ